MFIHGKIQLKNNYASQLAIHINLDIAILCMTWVVKGSTTQLFKCQIYVLLRFGSKEEARKTVTEYKVA